MREKEVIYFGLPGSGNRWRPVVVVAKSPTSVVVFPVLSRAHLFCTRALFFFILCRLAYARTFFVSVSITISLCFLHLCRRRGGRRMPENALLFRRIWCRTWGVVVVLLLLTPWFFVFEDLSRCSCWKCVFATISGAAVGNASLLDTIRAVREYPSLGRERERERERA